MNETSASASIGPTAEDTIDATIPRRGDGWSKSLYRWTLSLADKPSAPWALGIIAFAESSFFPIPPDVILIPMSLSRPRRAWVYALICTIGSVLGALLGYAIGYFLYNTIGQWLVHIYGFENKMAYLEERFAHLGWLFIVGKGVTPIPFKIVTLTCGILHYNLTLFVILCAATRAARFFFLAVIMNLFGEQIKALLERYFGAFMIILLAMIIVGFYIVTKVI